jgi:hypothetical protein
MASKKIQTVFTIQVYDRKVYDATKQEMLAKLTTGLKESGLTLKVTADSGIAKPWAGFATIESNGKQYGTIEMESSNLKDYQLNITLYPVLTELEDLNKVIGRLGLGGAYPYEFKSENKFFGALEVTGRSLNKKELSKLIAKLSSAH